jgi:mannan endo-1,4-beta-mannosidase
MNRTLFHLIFFFSIISANLHAQTKLQTLDFLKNISGKQIVLAQHNREPNAEPAKWTEQIKLTTGKYPAMWSGDFLFEQENIRDRWVMVHEAEKEWKQGALVQIILHTCPPIYGEPCSWEGDKAILSHLTDAEWKDLVTDGTTLNKNWKTRLDSIAIYLKYLQDNNVEVLFRPLHEMNQGKFWWGGRTGAEGTAKLYRITHDYLTREKGLHNLVWIWDVQDLDFNWAAYDPGDGYWDILALDVYDDATGYNDKKYQEILKLAGTKPIAIGECQKLPSLETLAKQPRWTFVMPWAELVYEYNTKSYIKELYNNAQCITLEQMKGWKNQ